MPRFQPRQLSQRTTNLVIGTSRTKYIRSKDIGAAVHSYRGASLLELCNLIQQYPQREINTLIIVAGFNDHRDTACSFIENWRFLIQLAYLKFQPRHLIIPKTISTSNNQSINRKIDQLNLAFYNLLRSLSMPIISPHFNRDFDHKIFSRDGIHFSRFGNLVFSQILKFYFNHFTCNQIK